MSLLEVAIVTAEWFTWAILSCSCAVSSCTEPDELPCKKLGQSCEEKTTVFSSGVIAGGQGATSLCCHSYTWKRTSDQSFKSIPSHGTDILVHATRQCLSPFKIKTGAGYLRLCLIVLSVCCCFRCFCVSWWRWHKRQELEHLTKRSIHLLSISRAPRHSRNYAGREDPADLWKLFSAAGNSQKFLRVEKGGE